MLTCKVGETIINCFDNKYDKYTLKKWSDKDKLVCPDCNKPYEYCHGEIVNPYFRHKEKSIECENIYSEPETQEHINGKMILYKWLLELQENGEIQNVKLESYISETKQRPDLYFEKDGIRYVIEYQCTPIATEYLERHRLYELAKVNDIWILGMEKYNISINEDGIIHTSHYKEIEKHTEYYLDVTSSKFIITNYPIKLCLPHKFLALDKYYQFNINDFGINSDLKIISLSNEILNKFIIEDEKLYNDYYIQHEFDIKGKEIIRLCTENLRNKYAKYNLYEFSCECDKNSSLYLGWIDFNYEDQWLRFFIKNNRVDCCIEDYYSVPFRGKRGGLGWRKETKFSSIARKDYGCINEEDITSFIITCLNSKVDSLISKIEFRKKYSNILKEYINEKILLINAGKEKVPEHIRFKFLKGFNVSEIYMKDTFVKEIEFLKSKNVKRLVFMIPKYNSYYNCLGFSGYVRVGEFNKKIIEYFCSFGFTNVKYLDLSKEVII